MHYNVSRWYRKVAKYFCNDKISIHDTYMNLNLSAFYGKVFRMYKAWSSKIKERFSWVLLVCYLRIFSFYISKVCSFSKFAMGLTCPSFPVLLGDVFSPWYPWHSSLLFTIFIRFVCVTSNRCCSNEIYIYRIYTNEYTYLYNFAAVTNFVSRFRGLSSISGCSSYLLSFGGDSVPLSFF